MKEKNKEDLLTTNQAAQALGRKSSTIRGWARKGLISGFQYSLTGRYFIPTDEVAKIRNSILKPIQKKKK